MDRSQVHRSLGASKKALLWCGLGLAYIHVALGGCAKSTGGETFGIEDEATSSTTSGSGTSDDLGTSSGDVSNGAGTTGDSTSGDTTSGATTGNPQTSGDCCVGGTNPGCSNPSIEQCVCAQDDYCCTTEWNDECVGLVDSLGCGSCGGTSSAASTSGGDPGGDCCSPSASPGCSDPAIEQCVCQQDDYCCTDEWNIQCVDQVDSFGCGVCGGSASASSSSGGNPGDECCFPSDQPGCIDPNVEQCVCAQDPYCCQTAWDDQCVMEVGDFGCGAC